MLRPTNCSIRIIMVRKFAQYDHFCRLINGICQYERLEHMHPSPVLQRIFQGLEMVRILLDLPYLFVQGLLQGLVLGAELPDILLAARQDIKIVGHPVTPKVP